MKMNKLDTILLVGFIQFFNKTDMIDELNEFKNELNLMMSEEIDLDAFKKEVERALDLLKSDLTLNLLSKEAEDASYGMTSSEEDGGEDDDCKYQKIQQALHILNSVVYLQGSKYLDDEQKGVIQDLLELVYQPMPWHRLIPLNVMRRNHIREMSEWQKIQFPWYNEFSKFPETGIEDFVHTTVRGIERVNSELLSAIWSDDPLMKFIEEKIRFFRDVQAKMSSSATLRWIAIADEVVREKVDSLRIAYRVVMAENTESVRFLAAFCGLGLTTNQRYNIMKPIETAMKSGRLILNTKVFQLVKDWHLKKITDTELAKRLFDIWIRKLAEEASRSQD